MEHTLAETALRICALGVIATAFLDLWLAFLQPRMLGIPFNGFHLVGRWASYFPQKRFAHDNIGKAEPMPHEVALGWIVHYLVGILFAGILIGLSGMGWIDYPTFIPAFLVGIGSVSAPFLIMQPAFGFGFAAAKTAQPWQARRRSLLTHTIFGLSLYAAGLLMTILQ